MRWANEDCADCKRGGDHTAANRAAYLCSDVSLLYRSRSCGQSDFLSGEPASTTLKYPYRSFPCSISKVTNTRNKSREAHTSLLGLDQRVD